MFCPACGCELPDDAVFCKKCGKRIPQRQNINTNAASKETIKPVVIITEKSAYEIEQDIIKERLRTSREEREARLREQELRAAEEQKKQEEMKASELFRQQEELKHLEELRKEQDRLIEDNRKKQEELQRQAAEFQKKADNLARKASSLNCSSQVTDEELFAEEQKKLKERLLRERAEMEMQRAERERAENARRAAEQERDEYERILAEQQQVAKKHNHAWLWWILIFVGVFLFTFCVVGGNSVYDIPVIGDLLPGDNNGGSLTDSQRAKAIANAMEPSNATVRNLALSAISSRSDGSYNISQVCDIYEYLYKRWVYVNDPNVSKDYYAKASDSARLLKGDCDDFAILMASCIQAIGGSPRIVLGWASNGEGHAYAEVYMTNNKSDADGLTSTISRRYNGQSVYYVTSTSNDGKKKYWLNLDWSANHPGGKYFPSTGKIQIIYPDGSYSKENFTPKYTYRI